MREIEFNVDGHPPAKSETLSMLGPRHAHTPRVLKLLEAARDAAASVEIASLGSASLGLELVLRCPRDRNRSDATNYLGGIADALEDKRHRSPLDHLGDLAEVALYDNDRQIEEIRYRWEPSGAAAYRVRAWSLEGSR